MSSPRLDSDSDPLGELNIELVFDLADRVRIQQVGLRVEFAHGRAPDEAHEPAPLFRCAGERPLAVVLSHGTRRKFAAPCLKSVKSQLFCLNIVIAFRAPGRSRVKHL